MIEFVKSLKRLYANDKITEEQLKSIYVKGIISNSAYNYILTKEE